MSNPTLGVLGDVELVHSFLEAVNTNLFMFVHDLTDLFPEEWTSVCQTYTTVAFLYKDADIDGIVQAQKFIAHHRISDGTSSVFLVPMVSSVHLRSTLIQEVPISQSSPQYAQVLNFIRAWRLPPTPPYFPPPPPPHQQSRPGTPKKAPKKKSQGTLRIQNSTAEMITESRTHQLGRQWIDLLPRLKTDKVHHEDFVTKLLATFLMFVDANDWSRFAQVDLKEVVENSVFTGKEVADPTLLEFLCHIANSSPNTTAGQPETEGHLRQLFGDWMIEGRRGPKWAPIHPLKIHGILTRHEIELSLEQFMAIILQLGQWPGVGLYFKNLWISDVTWDDPGEKMHDSSKDDRKMWSRLRRVRRWFYRP